MLRQPGHDVVRLSRRCLMLLAGAAILALLGQSDAQVFKCQGASGRVEYLSDPCNTALGQKALGEVATTSAPEAGPARRLGAAAYSAATANDADMNLAIECEGIQARVRPLTEELARRRQRVVEERKIDRDAKSAAATEATLAIDGVVLQIDEYERKGRVMGCDRIGLRINSPQARAQDKALQCQKLQDEMTFWRTGKGRAYASAPKNIVWINEDLRKSGCATS